MVKEYSNFISEKNRTIGEKIEKLSIGNEYALNIISQYTKDIEPTIRIANAVNLLPRDKQNLILKLILDEKLGREVNSKPDVLASVHTNLNESNFAGKNIFKCFLKSITALGQKEISQVWENCPKDFIFYFETQEISVEDLKDVMQRWEFFEKKLNDIEYIHNFVKLYYGVKLDGKFQYGINCGDEMIIIGEYILTKGMIKNILMIDSPSAKNLKKQLSYLDINQILLFGKIKLAMQNFNSGPFEKSLKPVIQDMVISFGFFDGQIQQGSVENIKLNLRQFLLPFKWHNMVQINVSVTDNHLFINIKIK